MFNILLVDDDETIRAHLKSVCSKVGGASVFEASDSVEALAVLNDNIIHLAIVDLHLPDILGTDLLRMIKQKYGFIKVFMLSGDNSFESVRQSFIYKADDYIEKPVDEFVLLAKLREFREKYFMGLDTIDLPKKSLSDYISFSLNAEFATLSRDSEEQFDALREQFGLDYDERSGLILSVELDGLAQDQNAEYYYSFLAEHMKQDFLGAELTFLFFAGRLTVIIGTDNLTDEEIKERLTDIKALFNENGIVMTVFLSERFGEKSFFSAYRTLLELYRNRDMYGKNEIVFASGIDPHKSQTAVVQRAKRFIQDRVYESFSLVDVAEYLNIHPNYLSKVFKQSEGIPFTDYVCDCKMKEAKRMLQETNLKIYTIAGKLHYYDTGYFIRIFKKYYGVSPNQFRQHMDEL